MKRSHLIVLAVLVLLLAAWQGGPAGASHSVEPGALAAPEAVAPPMVSYQGQVTISGTAYNGIGHFKFVVLDGRDTTWWSNDGTSTFGFEPDGAVPLPVSNGLFNVLLGDTALRNMTELPTDAFGSSERYIRVWFGTTEAGPFNQLSPDRRIAAVPYALRAEEAVNAGTLDGQDSADFQARVDDVCATGSSIRQISATGSVTCEIDDNTTYAAGNQLSLIGTTFNVNEGNASGLDADLLDGQHGTYYRIFMVTNHSIEPIQIEATCSDLNSSISMNAPRNGTIVVEANAQVKLTHVYPTTDELVLNIDGSTTSCTNDYDEVRWTIPDSFPSTIDEAYTFTVRRAFSVTAGTHTYYLNGRMASGGASADYLQYARLHATFYPEP